MTKKLSILFTLTATLLLIGSHADAQSEKFDPYLLKALDTGVDPQTGEVLGSKVPVMVVMQPVAPAPKSFWDEPTAADIEYARKRRTLETQWELRGFVDEFVTDAFGGDPLISDYMFLWSSNAMIGQVSVDLLWDIAEMESVTRLVYDRWERISYGVDEPEAAGEYTYGLDKIGVPRLREEFPELLGNDVVVGILDTGIDAEHPELKGKTVAWKDFVSDKKDPYDGNGHGTHVAGTIAGEGVNGTQIGVAPRAKLVIGKILSDRGSGRLSWILRGMEWVANPERRLQTNLRPRVVNNSWGGRMSADVRKNPFAQMVISWVELGIFPAFAAGNSGPSSKTIGTPGNLPMAFAVGATTADDSIARFSSRGPVKVIDEKGKESVIIKPDISAPGHKVLSSVPGGGYSRFSGTSMATPHLAGAVAILYQVHPGLNLEQMMALLTGTSVDLGPEGKDNDFGEGRLDLYRAIEKLTGGF